MASWNECRIPRDGDRQKRAEGLAKPPRTEIQQAPGDCHGKVD